GGWRAAGVARASVYTLGPTGSPTPKTDAMLRSLLLAAGLLCAGSAMANPPQYVWQLAQLARAPGETVDLRDDKGHILKRLKTQQLVWIYSVSQAIQRAAE